MNSHHRPIPTNTTELPSTVIRTPRDGGLFPGWGVRL